MSEEKKKPEEEMSKDIGSLLFKSRNVLITGQIDDKLAQNAVSQLLAFAEDGDEPINVFISSPGGHVESGDMVHGVIKSIKPRVRTIGNGWVASAGALIFVGADRSDRYCLPNARFLLHQPSGGVGGVATDIAMQARQIEIMRERFELLFAEATRQTPERIRKDTKRDFWLSSQEALGQRLLGQVIKATDELQQENIPQGRINSL